ncbi:transposase [Collimonas humicola]|uniref:transposase n=1 Tax=Collimonas humicola TaxID=2825886 RepID=UPI001B8BAF25|nr:transposase [Collimonas humicola]
MKLSDAQWEKLEPVLLGRMGDAGAKGKNNRLFIEAMILISEQDVKWALLPQEFGKWSTAYMRFRRWNEISLWQQLPEVAGDDSDLRKMMERIAVFSSAYTKRVEEKIRRQKSRTEYRDQFRALMASVAATPAESEELTEVVAGSEWVQLMNRYTPCILPTR